MVFLINAVNASGCNIGTAEPCKLLPTVWHHLAIHWASWVGQSQESVFYFFEGVNIMHISQEETEPHLLMPVLMKI